MSDKDQVLIEYPSSSVAIITLNLPQQHNAITMEMIEKLESALFEMDGMSDIRAVVLTGKGKSFCAGGDVKAMAEQSGMFAGNSEELMKRYQQGIQRIPLAIENFKRPIIAAVNGPAIGAGCDLACMCDLRIGSERTKMGETFVKLGLVPGDGGTFFLPRVVGYAKAMEMFLTGRIYSASECLSMGLLNEVVSPDTDTVKRAVAVATEIAQNVPLAVELTKSSVKAARQSDLSSQLASLSAYQGMAQRSPEHFKRLSSLTSASKES